MAGHLFPSGDSAKCMIQLDYFCEFVLNVIKGGNPWKMAGHVWHVETIKSTQRIMHRGMKKQINI